MVATEKYIVENLKKRSLETPNRANDWYTHFGEPKFVSNIIDNKEKLAGNDYGADVLRFNADDSVRINHEKVMNSLNALLDRGKENNN
ncbi:hypothetical protein BH23BAC3_BH23BAC3_24530 [soil metagenome]